MWSWRVKMPTQILLRLLLLLILIICNLSSRSVKGKVISCRLHIHMILNSQQRDSEGIGGNIWRCRKKYHVTSVRRHLQVGVAFPSTNRPRVGSRSPVAQSVTSRLLRILNWRGTPSSTPERDLTSAHSATFHATGLTPSNCIPRSTLGKNFTNAINATIRLIILPASKGTSRNTLGKICIIAINVNIKQHNQVPCKRTRRRTLVKSQTDAHHASIRVSQLVIWKFTLWGCTQERNRSNVSSATMLALLLVICSSTWGSTLGRDHSSATNAARLTKKSEILQNMSKFISNFDMIQLNSNQWNECFWWKQGIVR